MVVVVVMIVAVIVDVATATSWRGSPVPRVRCPLGVTSAPIRWRSSSVE